MCLASETHSLSSWTLSFVGKTILGQGLDFFGQPTQEVRKGTHSFEPIERVIQPVNQSGVQLTRHKEFNGNAPLDTEPIVWRLKPPSFLSSKTLPDLQICALLVSIGNFLERTTLPAFQPAGKRTGLLSRRLSFVKPSC